MDGGEYGNVEGLELDSIAFSEIIGGPRDGRAGLKLNFKGRNIGIFLSVEDAILLRDALCQFELDEYLHDA